jgi:hypothetical protein
MKAPDVRQIKHRAVEEESRKLREFQDAPSSVAVSTGARRQTDAFHIRAIYKNLRAGESNLPIEDAGDDSTYIGVSD